MNADIGEMKQRDRREDQEIVDYLVKEKVPYADMNEVFRRNFRKSSRRVTEYMKPYAIGHFNPTGNPFIA